VSAKKNEEDNANNVVGMGMHYKKNQQSLIEFRNKQNKQINSLYSRESTSQIKQSGT